MTPDVSVITGTYGRPKLVAMAIEQVRNQDFAGTVEHIIVTDGWDVPTSRVCKLFGMRSVRCKPERVWGARPKDVGVRLAKGRHVVFWDDDNIFHPHALRTLVETTASADMGVANAYSSLRRYGERYTMPLDDWRETGTDYMCVCVKRELALTATFETPKAAARMKTFRNRGAKSDDPAMAEFLAEQKPYDRRWMLQILSRNPSINATDVVIGFHL